MKKIQLYSIPAAAPDHRSWHQPVVLSASDIQRCCVGFVPAGAQRAQYCICRAPSRALTFTTLPPVSLARLRVAYIGISDGEAKERWEWCG